MVDLNIQKQIQEKMNNYNDVISIILIMIMHDDDDVRSFMVIKITNKK